MDGFRQVYVESGREETTDPGDKRKKRNDGLCKKESKNCKDESDVSRVCCGSEKRDDPSDYDKTMTLTSAKFRRRVPGYIRRR